MFIQLIIAVQAALVLASSNPERERIFATHEHKEWTFTVASEKTAAMARPVIKKFLSVEQGEGVGARVRRSVGRPEVNLLCLGLVTRLFTGLFVCLVFCLFS